MTLLSSFYFTMDIESEILDACECGISNEVDKHDSVGDDDDDNAIINNRSVKDETVSDRIIGGKEAKANEYFLLNFFETKTFTKFSVSELADYFFKKMPFSAGPHWLLIFSFFQHKTHIFFHKALPIRNRIC